MKRLFKTLAWIFGGLIALIVVAAIVLVATFDPNEYKDDIIAAVKKSTGRDLTIEGQLSLSLFPWLGVETGRVTFSNAPGFGNQPMARIESAAIKVAVLPLLRQEVVVDGIRLNGLQLHLARAANGRTNWDDLAKSDPATPKTPTPAGQNSTAALGMFTINRVEVRNSHFTWVDQTSGASYALRNVELNSGNVLGDKPAAIHLAFDFESGKPKVTRRVSLDGNVNFDAVKETLDVPELRLALGDLRLHAQARATDVLKAPKLQGRFDVPTFNLRTVLNDLNIGYAPVDDRALSQASLGANVDYGPQAISVSNLQLTLDQTRLTGKATIQQKPRTAYTADLAINEIDIDRYLPKTTAADKGANQQQTAADKGAVAIPLELLRETEADAQLKIERLKAFGIRSQQIVMKVAAHGGKVTLGPNQAKLYDGNYAGRTVIDASGKVPKYQFEEKLTGIRIGPFLKDADIFAHYSGVANIAVALKAQGMDADAIKKTLQGNVAVSMKDGAIEGIDFVKIDRTLKEIKDRPGATRDALIQGGLAELKPAAGDRTPFGNLQATATISDGIVTNKDLAVDAAKLKITGSGNINLVTSQYENYVVRINGVPCTFNGPLTNKYCVPDLAALGKEKLQERLEQRKDKLEDRFKNKLLDRLRR
jgi:AsmA protein